MKYKDITIHHTLQRLELSARIAGEYFHHHYIGYSQAEAKKHFYTKANEAEKLSRFWFYSAEFRGY